MSDALELYTYRDLAKLWRLTPETVARWVREDVARGFRVYRIRRTDRDPIDLSPSSPAPPGRSTRRRKFHLSTRIYIRGDSALEVFERHAPSL